MRKRTVRHTSGTTRTAVALVAAGALVLGACGDDDDESALDFSGDDGPDLDPDDVERDQFGVGLYNAGAGDDGDDDDDDDDDTDEDSPSGASEDGRVILPGTYEVGQRATSVMQVSTAVDVEVGPVSEDVVIAFEMTLHEEVVDIADNEVTIESTFESVDVVDAPDNVPAGALEAEFEPILGEAVVTTYSETGVAISDPQLRDGGGIPDNLSDAFSQSTGVQAFPSEPVGVGARWSSIDEIEAEGFTVEGETFYELIELTDDTYVIELTQSVPVSEAIQGTDMEGDFTATGQITGDPSNPLVVQMTYDQQGEFDISGQGQSGSMSLVISIDMTSE